ncbi:MAG TPA: DUF2079 domain-containing protein [Candidatus Brocadiia bacterium]|nr:DUF2079 domain-containing protein [Candidatus Brocadiia bacterium]
MPQNPANPDAAPRASAQRAPSRAAWVAVLALAAAFTLVLSQLAWRRYANFHFTQDGANFNHMLWRTAHGDFLPSYLYGKCHLGDHASLFLIPLAGLYALAPTMRWLLVLQALALGAAAVPFFLIARRLLGRDIPAVAASAAFLLHPGVASQAVNQVHEIQFVLVFFLAAFYCMETRRFGWFALFCALAATGKETVPLTLAMLGVYAFVLRRGRRWVIFPLAFSAAWLALTLGVLMPALWGGGYRHVQHFAGYGASGGEIASTLLTRPGLVWRCVAMPHKATYLFDLLLPCGLVLPLLGPAAMLALPDLAVNLLATEPALAVAQWHYSVFISASLCLAALQAIQWISRRLPARRRAAGIAVLVGLWACATALSLPVWEGVRDTREPPDAALRRQVLQQIPADAGVLAPQTLVASLVERRLILTPEQPWADWSKVDFIIVDEADACYKPKMRQSVAAALADGGFRLIWRKGSWSIYRRPAAHAPR